MKLQSKNIFQKLPKSYLILIPAQNLLVYFEKILTGKRGPCIPPIFDDNKFNSDSREKAELFNPFFANECSLITNTSELATNYESLTNKSLSNVSFTDDDIGKIVNSLRACRKVHGQDMKNIRMLKFSEILFTNLYV